MIRAACTIASFNYLPYARTLCESFLRFHPDQKFYVLLVDRLPSGFDVSLEKFETILAENLNIPDFNAVAFKYDILELNTNVKPTFLKLLLEKGVQQLIYFDPDILICSALDPIHRALDSNAIVLTPHCTSPNEGVPYNEVLLLCNGEYNLGFIAISSSAEARRFLDWWEIRCLNLGFKERWSGLFVDQKWINLVPCYFDPVKILKDPGCNVAYWNLHERQLQERQESWTVNGVAPLVFFHFSGISVDGGKRISKHSDQFDLDCRPDIAEIYEKYRNSLVRHGIRNSGKNRYAYGWFSNGEVITKLQRALFAANLDRFASCNPFDAEGSFYRWMKHHHLESSHDSVESYGRKAYSTEDKRVRLVHAGMRLMLRVLGPDRYTVLMKYFEYVSVLRNQKDVFANEREETSA
jgi:hypothetical protein